ncbi:class ii aldolase/adducin family protein [Catenovulum agarivorans DS-2]|uniref:Class ii aldolase/adducin family protein n=1 Tax=Catenovulum agarivorans DS-2 TaxID=1328313 RepID=W7Q9Z5_9ALTE|nr:class II aldolase/adducin family protein [Catenovulum agarivorans]EWH08816.1 class ii aldolase/adducin family protein [Catenovulum agarivorans DS-2]
MSDKQINEGFKYLHPKDQIILIMERVYEYEMTTTSGGNISIKDDNGDIWVTPGGVDKGSLVRDDIVCVKADGTIVGRHKPSSEYPFHLAIYNVRDDIKAVLHAHPPALVSFSAAGIVPNNSLLAGVKGICGDVDFVPYALPGSEQLGANIAESFAKGFNSVLLENHGTVTGADNLFTAFKQFETLDYTARIQIKAAPLGTALPLSDADQALDAAKVTQVEHFTPEKTNSCEKELRYEMCRFIQRSYEQKLITATEGTFAQRLSDNEFLLTPHGLDRKYMSPEDIVLVRDGMCENGKIPSYSLKMHQAIFKANPTINSCIIAHPPHLMAFNITNKTLDSKIIPEAYILMRDIQTVSFASSINNVAEVAEVLGEASPICMLQNNGIIVTGSNMLQAYDRLEVSEFTAKAVLDAYQLGHVNIMGEAEINELKEAFNLSD